MVEGYCPECQAVTKHKIFHQKTKSGVEVTLYRCQGRLDGVQCYGAHFAEPLKTREEYEKDIAEGDARVEAALAKHTKQLKEDREKYPCPTCHATGKVNGEKCPTCPGYGVDESKVPWEERKKNK